MKVKSKFHIGENYVAQGMVGTALNGLLKEQITECYCPQPVLEVIQQIVKDNYDQGFNDAMTHMRDYLLFVEVEEED